MDYEGWVARIREPVHPLLKSDAICDRRSIFMELMHLTDCHGVSAIVYGGVLGLILEVQFGRRVDPCRSPST